jgi:hypothetical protein
MCRQLCGYSISATARELEEQGEISIDYGEVSYIE